MTLRGVSTPGARLTTSHLTGVIRTDARTRTEFLRLAMSR
jgi:GTP cyclohydrolase I